MPAKFVNLVGREFNRLRVLEFAGRNDRNQALWKVQCSCDGKILTVLGYNLSSKNKNTESCGCLRREATARRSLKHGARRNRAKTHEYKVWETLIQRCTNPNDEGFKNYGGRGIGVYPPWLKFENFLAYLISTIGLCPPGLTIDRKDNDENYEPGNIKWSTRKEQANNRRPRQSAKLKPTLTE